MEGIWIVGIIIGLIFCGIGVLELLLAILNWKWLSAHPELYPLGKRHAAQLDMYGWIYDSYGDKAVRKAVMITSVIFIVLGAWLTIGIISRNAQQMQIDESPIMGVNIIVDIAGGELLFEDKEFVSEFNVSKFNVDKGDYENTVIKAEYKESMLLYTGTFHNAGSEALVISQSDIKMYGVPEDGWNKPGSWLADNNMDINGNVSLDPGESVPVYFWMTFSKEESPKDYILVISSGKSLFRLQ